MCLYLMLAVTFWYYPGKLLCTAIGFCIDAYVLGITISEQVSGLTC